MKRTLAAGALAVLLAGAPGCTGRETSLKMAPDVGSQRGGLEPGDYPTQRLLRIRAQGADGQGTMRGILRLFGPDRFQLSAVDTFGRRLWALDFSEPSLHFISYRSSRECRTDGPLALSAVSLEVLPVAEIPAVLLGRLPVSLRQARRDADGRMIDALMRRWSVKTDASGVESWTLWDENGPLLWYQRQERGGVLSHRSGEQFRWWQGQVESLEGAPEPLQGTPGLRTVACAELAAGA